MAWLNEILRAIRDALSRAARSWRSKIGPSVEGSVQPRAEARVVVYLTALADTSVRPSTTRCS